MAISFDDQYNLRIPGLDGVRLGTGRPDRQSRKSSGALGNMYPTMEKKEFSLPDTLARNVEKFRYNSNGTLSGWVPDAQGRTEWYEVEKKDDNALLYAPQRKKRAIGQWVNVEGLKLDESTLSGEAVGDVFIEDNNGPVAVFKQGDQVNGYMRFAVQNQKTADNLRLGNNSGTTSNVRQNSQRRTLL